MTSEINLSYTETLTESACYFDRQTILRISIDVSITTVKCKRAKFDKKNNKA